MASNSSTSALFEPITLSSATKPLGHRMALAPLTRFRANDDHVPIVPLMAEYYSQRASSLPGTLLITEATFVSPSAGGMDNVPGIWNQEQIDAWKAVTDAVHAKGGLIFLQLWSLGRAAFEKVAKKEGFEVHSSSDIPIPEEGSAVPKAMTEEEIKQRVKEYATAAKNAVEGAGFDGVEIHGANGYLIDQFLQDTCNKRTDKYGGSVENRSRFALEVVDAVVEAVGAGRTGIRLSPYSTFQGMRMADPVPQFTDVIRKIGEKHQLAYIHLVQTRIAGNKTESKPDEEVEEESLHFVLDVWKGPLLIAGGLTPESAKHLVDEEYKGRDVVAVFGRYFISTPDLPFRVKENIELNDYDRNTFYTPKSPVGYVDQPFSKEFEALNGVKAQI
ncbi:hypothetical protein QBC42DRAFT_108118 [Cladorrhinum samala]|uniref:NADH:flavin oxidoreductase/NADH oxidase N-terminal domain-containing protein n=1 Tax=Cladorrhinum samala TaxID=585594 RepID=A0AAV9HY44_9PEZI|nr:hypothetical protein QBC42DRAFT_108118 [Cladorrhinum samala]